MTAVEFLLTELRIEDLAKGEQLSIVLEICKQAKEMEYKQNMDAMQKGMELQEKENNRIGFRERNGLLPSQTEISDEEIEKAALYMDDTSKYFFKYGAKWYREQIKKI